MIPIPDHVSIIHADPTSDNCNDERDGSNWSSRMSFSRVKHGLGLFPRDQYAASGYNERVNSVEWPIRMMFSRMEYNWVRCCTENSLRVVTITGRSTADWLTANGDLTRWDAASYVSFSTLFFKETESRMFYGNWWRPGAGWRTSDALIPDASSLWWRICDEQDTQRDTERYRHKVVMFIPISTIVITTNLN